MEERLQKIIAQAGIASRRDAEALIKAGQVTVNGRVATLGDKADPQSDQIKVRGRLLKSEPLRYIILNKKRGTVSSTEAQFDLPTVLDGVNARERLYPVGRLDIDSEGLILLTNDGDLTNKITHPRYGCEKTYKVLVQGSPNAATLERWRKGVVLEGKQTVPATVKVMDHLPDGNTVLRVVMKEGRKRQIRKVAEMLGHPVLRLTRTHIGPIALGDLKPGSYRELSTREVQLLKSSVEPKLSPRRRRSDNRKPRSSG